MSHPGAIQTRSMTKSDETPSVLKETSSVLSVEDTISEHTTSTGMKLRPNGSASTSHDFHDDNQREAEAARQKQEEAWLKDKQDKVTAEIEKNKKWKAEAA